MGQSQSYRACSAACLTLQQAGPALLDEAGVGSAALATQDERLDVGDEFLLDSNRRDTSLEQHTSLLACTRGAELVE